jgi:hypothetical protein
MHESSVEVEQLVKDKLQSLTEVQLGKRCRKLAFCASPDMDFSLSEEGTPCKRVRE